MRTTGWWTVALTVAMTLAVGGGVGGLRAETKEEEAARYLKELKSNDPKKKALAAEGIGEIGRIKASLARPAVPLLLEALTDKNAEVRAKGCHRPRSRRSREQARRGQEVGGAGDQREGRDEGQARRTERD
jgi:lactate dehydrogenase-like 2-hydroxyacid dehydrogenase